MITLSDQQVLGHRNKYTTGYIIKISVICYKSHYITVTYSINLHHFITISVLGNKN